MARGRDYSLDEGRYQGEETPWHSRYPSSEWDRAAREMTGYAERERGGLQGAARRLRHEDRWRGPHSGKGPKGYKRSDDKMQEEINERLTEHPHIDARDIEVEVHDAEVTLKGFVASRYEKRAAEDVVESVVGVQDVHNELRIVEREQIQQRESGEPWSEREKERPKMDMKAMMDVYAKLATPGPQHKLLAGLEGSWTTKTTAWMDPSQPAMEGTGTCEQKMLLGGRYLQQEYAGEMAGSPFAGINILGFDNYTKKYVSAWIDSMSTGIYYFEGTGSIDGNTITQESRYEDPVRGFMTWRSVTRIVDQNRLEYEMYLTPKGGREERMMEMTMTRRS